MRELLMQSARLGLASCPAEGSQSWLVPAGSGGSGETAEPLNLEPLISRRRCRDLPLTRSILFLFSCPIIFLPFPGRAASDCQ